MLHNSVVERHPCLPQPDQQSASMQRRISKFHTSAQGLSPFASYLMGNLTVSTTNKQTNKQTNRFSSRFFSTLWRDILESISWDLRMTYAFLSTLGLFQGKLAV